jgi:hypothetical protein
MADVAEKPWWAPLGTLGSGLADRLSESAQVYAQRKINKELDINPLQTLTTKDASKAQNVQAANAPIKGKDSDGSTLSADVVTFGGVEMQMTMVKKAGIAAAALLALAVGYKTLKK